MARSYLRILGRGVAVTVLAAVIVVGYRHLTIGNHTIVALTFLLAVLGISATWGLVYAVYLAIIATLAFNYFFLPPIRTFTIADPQNWAALFTFLVTAVTASQLSERARKQASDANRRRREAERMYSLSQQLLVTENAGELVNLVPRFIVDTFGVDEAALLLQSSGEVYRSSANIRTLDREDLHTTIARGDPIYRLDEDAVFMPVRLGMRIVGAYGIVGQLSRETLEGVGSLIAIAIERAGAIERLTKTEAVRENEKLRSALLDSVTHEFRTPLTSIKASVTSLLSGLNLGDEQRRELLTVIDEETDRLNRLVGEAAEMAQLDSQQVELELQPCEVREIVDVAMTNAKQALAKHSVELRIPADLPLVNADVQRASEVFLHLLENAGKYSPADTAICITAEVSGQQVVTSIADRGPGIDSFEQSLIFEKFYRGRDQRHRAPGTGMGLAIVKAIVEAHSGTISVTSQLGHGSVFSVALPIAIRAA